MSSRAAVFSTQARQTSRNRRVELTRLPRLAALEALAPRGSAVKPVIDAVQGQERPMTGMVSVDDSRDQGVVVLVGDEVGLAPDRQCVPVKRLPGRAQVFVGELAKNVRLRSKK